MQFGAQINYVIEGISNGAIYGLLALSLVTVYRASRVINFAQGELAMVVVCLASVMLEKGAPAWMAVSVALGATILSSISIHATVFRRLGEGQDLNSIVVSVGLLMIINSTMLWFFGSIPKPFPSPFGEGVWSQGPLNVSYRSIGTCVVEVILVGALFAFFEWSRAGVALKATSENWAAARLQGIPVRAMVSISWGLATLTGGIAGLLAAPKLFVHPAMMQTMLVYAIASAVLGGLDSSAGALLGGILIGVIESCSASIGAIGSDLRTAVTMGVLVMMMLIRPRGILGQPKVRKV